MTFVKQLPALLEHLPALLRLRAGSLLPTAADPALVELGLADENGLTKKGLRLLDHLYQIAALLDLPLI